MGRDQRRTQESARGELMSDDVEKLTNRRKEVKP